MDGGGTVCDDFFDLADAGVVCWQLGLWAGDSSFEAPIAAFGAWAQWSVSGWTMLNCDGTEARLIDCPRINGGDYIDL